MGRMRGMDTPSQRSIVEGEVDGNERREANQDEGVSIKIEASEEELIRRVQDYVLPAVIQSDVMSWIRVANTLALTTALFAGVQMTLAQLIASNLYTTAAWRALQWFTYSGAIINLAGTASAVVIINMSSSLVNEARYMLLSKPNSLPYIIEFGGVLPKALLKPDSHIHRMKAFGMPRIFFLLTKVVFACFLLGTLFIFTSISLWVWITEPSAIAGPLMAVVVPAVWLALSMVYY